MDNGCFPKDFLFHSCNTECKYLPPASSSSVPTFKLFEEINVNRYLIFGVCNSGKWLITKV